MGAMKRAMLDALFAEGDKAEESPETAEERKLIADKLQAVRRRMAEESEVVPICWNLIAQ